MYLYSDDQLKAMPLDELNALSNAAWRIADAMANYRDKNWNESTQAVTDMFHREYWRIFDILVDREVAIDRFWREFSKTAAYAVGEMLCDIENLWSALARIAALSNANPTVDSLWDMEHYVKDVIWQKSDQPSQDVNTFMNELYRKRSNAGKMKYGLKWARANWTFGIPDFK
jgi:hypothetical protein